MNLTFFTDLTFSENQILVQNCVITCNSSRQSSLLPSITHEYEPEVILHLFHWCLTHMLRVTLGSLSWGLQGLNLHYTNSHLCLDRWWTHSVCAGGSTSDETSCYMSSLNILRLILHALIVIPIPPWLHTCQSNSYKIRIRTTDNTNSCQNLIIMLKSFSLASSTWRQTPGYT